MKRLLIALLLCAGAALGQPSGGIPPSPQKVLFANLGTPLAGNWRYCTDCTTASPCAGSGSGAFAFRSGGTWKCNVGTPAVAGVTSVGLVGTANQITVTGTSPITGSGSWTLSFPAGGVTLPGTTNGTFSGSLAGNASSADFASFAGGANVVFVLSGNAIDFLGGGSSLMTWTAGQGPRFADTGGDVLVWQLDLSGLADGVTRIVTVPAANGGMVLDTATQVLTNKTLTDAVTGGVTPAVSNTTTNSCGTSAASIVGNNTTGVITVGATAGTNCTITFTVAAPTRRQCTVTNETTANLSRSTYLNTTHSTVEGTFVAGDKISYVCSVY